MILEHIALYTNDLEGMRKFYEKYFGAKSNSMYHNLKALGLTHMAFRVGNKEKVDELTEDLIKDGFLLKSGPRMTGDGYYESCIFDPEGNEIEIVA
ncbi:MAG: lactoylglutathione lyase [Bacillales bacterium]|nr:lactoylglutathione lyase [Bacillales bacterium]